MSYYYITTVVAPNVYFYKYLLQQCIVIFLSTNGIVKPQRVSLEGRVAELNDLNCARTPS